MKLDEILKNHADTKLQELLFDLSKRLNVLETIVRPLSGTSATSFVALTDTPANYSGSGSKLVAVNSGATGIEFIGSIPDTITFHDSGDSARKLQFEVVTVDAGQTRVLTVPNYNGTIATLAGTEALSNKTITSSSITILDTNLTIQDNGNVSKQFRFNGSLITAGNTRTISIPDYDASLATQSGTETLTNKTLTSPTIDTPTINVRDDSLNIQDNADPSKGLRFQLSGITAAATRTLTIPDSDGTLALLGLAQTFSALQTFSSGIKFANETLSTYDEGTWTPAIEGSSSNPSVTYGGTLNGTYVRFNNMYFYSFRIPITTISGGSGDIRITLPATAVTPTGPAALRTSGVDFTGTPVTTVFNPTSGQAYGVVFSCTDNGAETTEQISALANGDVLQAQGFFFI